MAALRLLKRFVVSGTLPSTPFERGLPDLAASFATAFATAAASLRAGMGGVAWVGSGSDGFVSAVREVAPVGFGRSWPVPFTCACVRSTGASKRAGGTAGFASGSEGAGAFGIPIPFAASIMSIICACDARLVRMGGMPQSNAQKRSSRRGNNPSRSLTSRSLRVRLAPGWRKGSRLTKYCCWLPWTVPGRMARAQPMKLRAV